MKKNHLNGIALIECMLFTKRPLWTPKTRWNEVSEQGFVGGPVIPATYDGGDTALEQVWQNVFKSSEIGSLVANDFKSSVIFVPLHDIDSETGEPLDYQHFSEKLEQIRSRFQNNHIKIHITGKDNAYLNAHYCVGSDIFIVVLETPPAGNSIYPVVVATDLLKWRLSQLKGVQNVISHVDYLKRLNSVYMEGNLKWMAVPRSQTTLNNMILKIPPDVVNQHGKLTPMIIYLDDHKAQTLQRVVDTVEAFAKQNNTDTYRFVLAAGNAGIEAATNIEVKKALGTLILLVYSILSFVCVITFKSIRAALCMVIPLMFTSMLCEALMAKANIGIKVATLPVIAVGVGIGVDYGINMLYKLLHYRTQGHPLTSAFYHTVNTTGRAVAFTGLALAIGVATWAFSPIKFQADMGFLLTFMFLWNMLGAMVLTPALARFLYFNTDFRRNRIRGLLWLTIL